MDGLVPDIAIDTRRIRPICLDRDDIEPVPFDQPARDLRARAIELGCSVGCFAEQHDPCVSKAVKYCPEGRIVQIGQRLGCFAEKFRY